MALRRCPGTVAAVERIQLTNVEKTMRRRWKAMAVVAGLATATSIAMAQDVAGKWVAEITSPVLLEPAYARVSLERTGDALSGTWGSDTVKGSVKGSTVTLTFADTDGKDAGGATGKIAG